MDPSPSLAPTSYTIADHLSKPLPTTTHQRIVSLIGAGPTVDPLASADPTATVAAPTVVASTVDPLTTTATTISDSVPTLHPNPAPTLPIVLDTGASVPLAPAVLDYLSVSPASFGLIRSAKVYSTDPYTLITGEDTTLDLSSPDLSDLDTDLACFELISDLSALTKVSFDIREVGTSTLAFIFDTNSVLIKVFVTPTQVDWIHWVPLPRLTPTESYFHLLGFDYIEAFAFLHLYPLWIALLYLSVSALFALIRSK